MMRPQKQASQKEVEQSYEPKKLLGQAASLAGGVAGGSALARFIPLLSNLIPSSLAVKGLSKISPRLGNFFAGITSTGNTIDDGLDYLRKQAGLKDEEDEDEKLSQGYQGQLDQLAQMQSQLDNLGNEPQQQQVQQPQQMQQAQGNSNAKDKLLQAMQTLAQNLKG